MSIEKSLEEHEVLLGFLVDSARLNLEEAGSERAPRSISLSIRFEGHEDVRLSDKRSLKKVDWSMYLVEATEFNENATKQGAIGFLSRFDERVSDDEVRPETCHISAALKPDKFLSLLLAIQSGRVPESVTVSLRGMKYGWEPDGSGKEWDEKQVPHPPIAKISFSIPLFGSRSDSSEQNEETIHVPASSADIRSLQAAISEASAVLRSTIWKVFWSAVVVAVLLWLGR